MANLSLENTHVPLSPSSHVAFSIVCMDVDVQLDSNAMPSVGTQS